MQLKEIPGEVQIWVICVLAVASALGAGVLASVDSLHGQQEAGIKFAIFKVGAAASHAVVHTLTLHEAAFIRSFQPIRLMIMYIIYMIPRLQGIFAYLSFGSRDSNWLISTTQVQAAEMGGLGTLTIWVVLAAPGWVDGALASLLILLSITSFLQVQLHAQGMRYQYKFGVLGGKVVCDEYDWKIRFIPGYRKEPSPSDAANQTRWQTFAYWSKAELGLLCLLFTFEVAAGVLVFVCSCVTLKSKTLFPGLVALVAVTLLSAFLCVLALGLHRAQRLRVCLASAQHFYAGHGLRVPYVMDVRVTESVLQLMEKRLVNRKYTPWPYAAFSAGVCDDMQGEYKKKASGLTSLWAVPLWFVLVLHSVLASIGAIFLPRTVSLSSVVLHKGQAEGSNVPTITEDARTYGASLSFSILGIIVRSMVAQGRVLGSAERILFWAWHVLYDRSKAAVSRDRNRRNFAGFQIIRAAQEFGARTHMRSRLVQIDSACWLLSRFIQGKFAALEMSKEPEAQDVAFWKSKMHVLVRQCVEYWDTDEFFDELNADDAGQNTMQEVHMQLERILEKNFDDTATHFQEPMVSRSRLVHSTSLPCRMAPI